MRTADPANIQLIQPKTKRRFTRKTGVFLVLLAVLPGIACNLTGLLTPTQAPDIPEATEAPIQTPEEIPETIVTFEVQVPPETPLDQPIYLTVLDEVTGLALNARRFEMEAVEDTIYAVDLTLPVGSTIKYKYTRQGDYQIEEYTSAERPVRYRMYSVDGPGLVKDVVSGWTDTAFSGPAGRVIGQVADAQSGLPIANILVLGGGAQTITASDGFFILEGLPPGTHNLVAYALDGWYRSFQQGATIAPDSSTPAQITMTPAPLVDVTFMVSVPQGTMPAIPLRMAGNLYQLGNTFADLSGGVSTLAARMPALTHLPDGRYSLELALPAGADIQYKYTLGDGLWNAEHGQNGEFRLRRLIVPNEPTIVEDTIDNWGSGANGPLLFDLQVPSSTPDLDFISIQFNPYGWTEPIPMWRLGEDHWVYVLYSPLNLLQQLGYRYCRNDQCSSADDAQTPGSDHPGRLVEITGGNQTITDTISAWAWLDPNLGTNQDNSTDNESASSADSDFFAGIQLQSGYHPSWIPRSPVTFKEIQQHGANWALLSPTWTYTRQTPPVLEPVTGKDPLWIDVENEIESAQSFGLKAALYPTATFPEDMDEWWTSAPRDFAWWLVWFERYRTFALHHADLAKASGAQALVLGGDWVTPALPNSVVAGGEPSGVPFDTEQRWRDLLGEVRSRFPGQILWASPATQDGVIAPPFLDLVDQVIVEWSLPLVSNEDPANEVSQDDLTNAAVERFDSLIKPFHEQTGKPVILSLSYLSANGAMGGCLPDPEAISSEGCLDQARLARPNPDIPSVVLDLNEQDQVYEVLLGAVQQLGYFDGVISAGFYPPAALQDKSASVHGKPAGAEVSEWFHIFTGTPSE